MAQRVKLGMKAQPTGAAGSSLCLYNAMFSQGHQHSPTEVGFQDCSIRAPDPLWELPAARTLAQPKPHMHVPIKLMLLRLDPSQQR
ncbi:unnamed protein product [Rangifer tarandus platyrhynchus]|uniref:Uncharacterized protein n=1 Tax=Rangifer tarandus platyrhynchus TaxID=3082113 RepID=A0ABN8Z2Y5_RANTA|nr:unnamed protein product [Rangifer tarandus platyrhynchus]